MLNPEYIPSWLREAGRLALRYFRQVEPAIKDNKTYVTEADLAVQAFLKEKIDAHYPTVGILAEENGLAQKPKAGDTYLVLDPIDGTASFVAGLPVWGIALGVIEGKTPAAGYFYLPITGDLYHAHVDGPVCRNGVATQLKPFERGHRESTLLAMSRVHQKFKISPDFPGKVRSLGSTIAHICYVATGSADAALIDDVHLWDLAAGLAILYRNGGVARYLDGTEFSVTDDLLAGNGLDSPLLLGQERSIAYFSGQINVIKLTKGLVGH
ncbi:MAG: inositol monophosphatase [Anaerolineae bacterium]|nr:inositol monophosphatase [Anaerolineae bacterium]